MSRTSWVLLLSFLLSGDSLSSIDRAFISLAFMFTHSSTHGTRCDQAKRMRLMDVHLYICADLWSVISDNGRIITIRIRRAIAICDKIIKDLVLRQFPRNSIRLWGERCSGGWVSIAVLATRNHGMIMAGCIYWQWTCVEKRSPVADTWSSFSNASNRPTFTLVQVCRVDR